MHLLLLQLFLVRFHHKYFASALSPFFPSSLQCFNPIIASFNKNTMIYITLLGDIMRLGMQVLLCLNKRSEEHTSELQSRFDLVCRLLLPLLSTLFPYTTLFRSLLQLFLVRFHHKYFASALSPFFPSSLQCFNPIIASFNKNTMIYITLLGDIMRLGMQVLLCLNK